VRLPFLGILLAIAIATTAHPASAATITVTTTVDELNTDGDCSLREAVRAANTNLAVDACAAGQNDQTDTIMVPAGTYTLMVAGNDNDAAGGDLDLRDNSAFQDLVITGAGAATTIVQACAVDQIAASCPMGQGLAERVFHLIDANVAISGLTVRHGLAAPLNSVRDGNGILAAKLNSAAVPELTLTDVVVTKNGTTSTPEIGCHGGIKAFDIALTLTRVTVSDNVGNVGAGVYSSQRVGGPSTLTMTDCTVSGNVATSSGGGVYNELGSVATLTGCTISGNDGGQGGGVMNASDAGTMTLTNCTVSGNRALGSSGGQLAGGGGVLSAGTAALSLQSTTVTLNRLHVTTRGSGGITSLGSLVLRNSIVAGNIHDQTLPSFASPDCDDAGGGVNVTSEGHNIVGTGCKDGALVDGVNGDQLGTLAAPIDAGLGPLADNGGPTLTHAWLAGSPAIDAANPAPPGSAETACPTTDQRGETRPRGAACDVGAVELGDVALAVDAVQPPVGGNSGTVQARVFGKAFVAGTVVRLVRAGFADVAAARLGPPSSIITVALDLRGVAPGLWSIEVENPDGAVATLPDGFTVEAGGQPDLWIDLQTPTAFQSSRVQSVWVFYGNRGTVDALATPIWLSLSDALTVFVPFAVEPPPVQPGQIATDWTRVAIDVGLPPAPMVRDSFPLLLPIVPAGASGKFRLRVRSPITLEPPDSPDSVDVEAVIGTPYFQPDLPDAVVAGYVARAKEYAVKAHGTTSFPSDAAIAAYVRTQLDGVVANGRSAAAASVDGALPLYSQNQLMIDTGQFIAGESATAASALGDRSWLARLLTELVWTSAEARLNDPCLQYKDPVEYVSCEAETQPCKHGCSDDPPVLDCEKLRAEGVIAGPCKPKKYPVPFQVSRDPNAKAGPGGAAGFIDGVAPLAYTVQFENVATASGDAFEVTVTDQLDTTKYDLDTFSFGDISFASKYVPVPPGQKSFSTEVDMRPAVNILVGVDAALDTVTGIVTWKFTTLDPETGEFPEEPEDGFLPPNVTSPEGEGEMLFFVSLKPGFGLGTTVCNDASIVFDFNEPIVTNEFCNTIGDPENCENCIDDDGDGLVDRADPDCTAPANGSGAGVGDAKVGKTVAKCATTIRKAGAKLASTHLKQLGACQKAVADCVQLKPGDAACLTKAQATCAKARTAIPGAEAKIVAAITKACNEPTVAAADLLADTGVGFEGEDEACVRRGLAAPGSIVDVAECVRRQHACAAERVLGAAVPRARELLVLGGFTPAEIDCVDAVTNGGGSALAIEKRKALRKCDGAIQKAAAKLLAGRTKAGQACGAAVFGCVQTKPGDAACLTKSGATCVKAVAALPKLQAAFTSTIAKSCGAAPLGTADLLASEGLGAAGLAATCARLGVANLTSVADLGACLERHLACRADQMLESTTPRLEELLGLGGVALP